MASPRLIVMTERGGNELVALQMYKKKPLKYLSGFWKQNTLTNYQPNSII